MPPQVQPGPRILKVLVGEALDLNCAAKGSPEPQLTWSKDGVALQGGEPEGSIHFTAIQTADAGTYRCEASSSAGADAWELELRVLGESVLKPSAPPPSSLRSSLGFGAAWTFPSSQLHPGEAGAAGAPGVVIEEQAPGLRSSFSHFPAGQPSDSHLLSLTL